MPELQHQAAATPVSVATSGELAPDIRHSRTETATVADEVEPAAAYLEQLKQAREADRTWRQGRAAEVERQVRRGAWIAIGMGAVLYIALKLVVAWLARRALAVAEPGGGELFWMNVEGITPALVIPLTSFSFGRWASQLREDARLCASGESDPVAGEPGSETASTVHQEGALCGNMRP